MSYNNRRTTGNYGNMNIRGTSQGMMRGQIHTNFVPGGQFQPGNKPYGQTPPRQQSPTIHHQPQQPLPPAPLKSALKKEVKLEIVSSEVKQEIQPVPQILPQGAPTIQQNAPSLQQITAAQDAMQDQQMQESNDPSFSDNNDESTGENGEKKKPFWGRKTGKISKREKRGRRNQRLRKILQPKNSLMVLNELVGGQKFNIIEKSTEPLPGQDGQGTFIASVHIDGQEYVGYGKSKAAAKSAAAENSLKHIILNKLRANKASSTTSSVDGDGDVPMEDSKEDSEEDVSWLHIASYAIHKLFTSWDSEGVLMETLQSEVKAPATPKQVSKKPAKQLPANAETMNPVMLLNQMRPGTTYEEVCKEGNPPGLVTFTVKTSIDGEDFFGRGPNKKLARKNCAQSACSKLFDLIYPGDNNAQGIKA